MLKFREIDYKNDVDEIIQLLNANFDTEHTRRDFLWKHYENPFGRSYGLLAVDNERIVALRMFMRWEFYCGKKVIKAIRPVDTCTDHEYRGRGLFKKITLKGLENIKDEYELVFNTPNSNSKPGYLKMGWETYREELSYRLGMINFLSSTETFEKVTSAEISLKEWQQENSCRTVVSKNFMEWRYRDPDYTIVGFKKDNYVIYRLTTLKGFRVLVLIDIFGHEEDFNRMLRSVCGKENVKLVYFLNNWKNNKLNFLFSVGRGSQTVVIKDDKSGISEKLRFSVGDLEGKL